MSARTRYRSARRAVLAVGLFVGIGYPLALALGGAVLVQLRTGARGTSLSVHNARPWLIIAAVAAVLLVLDWVVPAPGDRRRAAPGEGGTSAAALRGLSGTEQALRSRLEALQAARQSEREFNAALDAHLAGMWPARPPGGDRRAVADLLLELTMELVEAPAGLLVLGHDARGVVAARGVADPPDLVAQFADGRALGPSSRQRDRAGTEWLVLTLPGDPGGYIALGGRPGGFAGLDDEALSGVAARVGSLMMAPAPGRAASDLS